jgi:hypothetical protein
MLHQKLISVELSLLALEHHEFEAYVAEINEILNCIEFNSSYDEAPGLTSKELGAILESMCQRSDTKRVFSLQEFIYGHSDFNYVRKKIRNILLNS